MNNITDYHAKLFAHELLRRYPLDSMEKFSAALMDSQVDLNPHQLDAALFVFRSPFSKGALLADEVGLGKTIEAGIVLSQMWAERKRKILIILPSSLRKQWHQELLEKFYLPSAIMESGSYNKAVKEGIRNPFISPEIVICSYYFARNKAHDIRSIDWDLVVIDEAHRLRNVYKTGNKVARDLKLALEHSPKLLLTATPLQNSLLELYGLVSFIDEHAFGDLNSFRSQFSRLGEDSFDDLKRRLGTFCKRTLRRQVLEYIQYTARKAYTQEFYPSEDENALYEMVSDYLRRPNLQALPSSQRNLMTLVLRKLLASSTFAIAGALDALANKLEKRLKDDGKNTSTSGEICDDFDGYEEIAEELEADDEEEGKPLTYEDRHAIKNEIKELRKFFDLAMKITQNAKGDALLSALETGFKMAKELGGAEKAIIFTESRRTQNYLVSLLSDNGYAEDIVLFNGSNNDHGSSLIYGNWKEKYVGTDRITGSRAADIRAALVDHFKENAKIMIATEAAAEGINLQFCSLVVNYDLPWNPQRIEQRIGRCHRYGQKYDVVVVNFLNKTNAADQRVYELLSEKFHLFNGVFGASDEVLGSIESGVDFEKRISEIYQTCRSPDEIQASFDALQSELSEQISENMTSTRQKLLENFDAEVAEKLSVYKEKSKESLNRFEALLWDITQHRLKGDAIFDEANMSFRLSRHLIEGVPLGLYLLKRQDEVGHHYRPQHPLAKWVLDQASNQDLNHAELCFDYSGFSRKISTIKHLVGKAGQLLVKKLTVIAAEAEDYIILAAETDDGYRLDAEESRKLFYVPATVKTAHVNFSLSLQQIYDSEKTKIIAEIGQRDATFFEEEMDKLNRWADDKRKSLRLSLKEYDDQITQLKKDIRTSANLPEKLEIQKKIRKIEKKRDDAWRDYDESSRKIEKEKDCLIDKVEAQLKQNITEETLFTVRWTLV